MSTGFKDWYTRISVSCGQITVAHNSTHVNKPSNVHGRWGSHEGWLEEEIQAEWPLSLLNLGGASFPFCTTVLDRFPEHALPACSRSTSGQVSAPRSLAAHMLWVSPKTLASFSPGILVGLTRGPPVCPCHQRGCPPEDEKTQCQGSRNTVFNYKWERSWMPLQRCWNFQFIALCKRRSNVKPWHLCFLISMLENLWVLILVFLLCFYFTSVENQKEKEDRRKHKGPCFASLVCPALHPIVTRRWDCMPCRDHGCFGGRGNASSPPCIGTPLELTRIVF